MQLHSSLYYFEFLTDVHRALLSVETGGEGQGPLTFLFEGAQYDRGPHFLKNASPSFS